LLTSAAGVAQSLSAVYSDADGWSNVKTVSLQVNTAASGANGIWALHDRTVNNVYLATRRRDGLVGSWHPGPAASLCDTQGTLNCSARR